MSNNDGSKRVNGAVKWFDPEKGFGFITAPGMEKDILIHANVLRNYGQSSVADGAGVDAMMTKGPNGWMVSEIFSITPPAGASVPLAEVCGLSAADIQQLPLLAARVKWFDKGKGFGFGNTFGDARDVFIHAEVLLRSGLATLSGGEAVAIRVTEGKRGLMAVQVLAWEAGSQATANVVKAAVAAK
jgi:CspA family cold shock protein